MQNYIESDTTGEILLEEAIGAAGYTLGLMAAEKPEFRVKVEHYYREVATKGLTVTVVNAGLQQLMNQGIAYQVLAYKMARIVRLAGGQIDPEGNITELGKITTGMLEIGKNGYKEITERDKASLDILWLKDANLTYLDNLPDPEVLAEEIVETIEAALTSFRDVASELNGNPNGLPP